MTEAYDGRQVVGMDLHRRRSVLVRMTGDGRKLETVRIENSPQALRAVLARAGKNPRVVVEATYGWYWAADVLEEAGAEVHLAHPLGVKAFTYRRVKDDERDAADLADLLRMGRLPEAWIAPPEIRELRELTRYRHKLVGLRTSCRDQVHAVLAKLGIPVTCTDIFGTWGNTWLDGLDLPQPYAGKVASLRQLNAGLTPRHRESDLKVSRGHVTKQGSRMLRWAVCEAIQRQPADTRPRQVKDGIIARRGKEAKNTAKVAAARELLTLVFYGMRDGHIRRASRPGQAA